MNIGEIAKQSGLPAKTIRYYEDIKLIKPSRDANGYRNFDTNDLHKLHFLARARSLGFNIDDCRHLLALFEDNSRASSDVKELAQSHLQRIDQKLAELQGMRDTLANLVHACAGDGRPDCPILDDLAKPHHTD
ncbi:MAG: Cu(I)-responsive transcriptional regulator [Granulosicoccaceae bacterium]